MSDSANASESRPKRNFGNIIIRLLSLAAAVGVGTFTILWIIEPPREKDEICWRKFEQAIRNEAEFRNLSIKYARGVHWVKGELQSECELERLLILAHKCGIHETRLDGPYAHSISITISGTSRAKEFH